MKPDQERVKNLLLDTVTLLCKNSLQYENKLRVEGLLGVSVDDSDVFFLHISENFQNSTPVELNNATNKDSDLITDSNRDSSHDREDSSNQIQDSRDSVSEQVRVKSEVHEIESDSEDLIITSSSLNSPHTVAQPATMVAGQRRSPHKRTHSPSFRDSVHNSSQISQNSQRDSLNSANQMTSLDGDYSYTECGDGTSFDQLQSQQLIKQESGWDQEPSAKRHMSDSSPWPNLAGLSDLAAQAAQASQDGDDGGGGSYSQPGCSSWPSASTALLPNSGVQDSTATSSRRQANTRKRRGRPLDFRLSSPVAGPLLPSSNPKYACVVCGKSFADGYRLQRHTLIHTGEKPFGCQFCGAFFNQKAILSRHVKKQHADQVPPGQLNAEMVHGDTLGEEHQAPESS